MKYILHLLTILIKQLLTEKDPIPAKLTSAEIMPVLNMFSAVSPLSKKAEQYLTGVIYAHKINKGKILHKAGNICNDIYFVIKGALRGYIIEGTKDCTTWITVEGEMVAPIYSFINQVPTLENVQAIEDCQLLGMSHDNLQKLYQLFPETNIVARAIFEKYYSDAEIRALIARLKKAETKYAYFLETYSHLSNRIQLNYIASFLGMNLETLSRVRANMAKR